MRLAYEYKLQNVAIIRQQEEEQSKESAHITGE